MAAEAENPHGDLGKIGHLDGQAQAAIRGAFAALFGVPEHAAHHVSVAQVMVQAVGLDLAGSVIGDGGQQAVAKKFQVALEAAGRHFVAVAVPVLSLPLQSCPAFFSDPIFLQAAGGFIGNGHFDGAIRQKRSYDLV